jgi:isopenicillin-N epimerase
MPNHWRDDFDLDPDLIYLNNGTHSITPRSVTSFAERYRAEYERNPTAGVIAAGARLWTVQQRLAEFLNADPLDLYLRANVTLALNDIILGVDLPAGSEILSTSLEYGAIANQCRYRAERDGLKHRVVEVDAGRDSTPGDMAKQILSALRPETALLLVSHIAAGNGAILPIRDIAAETRKRGVLLVVDGAHASGSLELDFATLQDVDFYSGSLHKWMLGHKGTSFGWVARRNHDRIRPTTAGWMTFGTNASVTGFAGGDLFQLRMMICGCIDFSPFVALEETLAYWRKRTPAAIRARIRHLRAVMETTAAKAPGIEILTPRYATDITPLLLVRLENARGDEEFRRTLLTERRLQIGNGPAKTVRLSAHVYNTEDEIARAFAILAAYRP